MITAQRIALVACLLCPAPLLGGCDSDVDEFIPDCDLQQSGRDVAGRWMLEGSGERAGCDDPRLNGDLDLSLDLDLEVVAMAEETSGEATGELADDPQRISEADAFVIRILRADHTLSADDPPGLPDAVTFSGATTGSCVDFLLEEDLGGGEVQTISFQGSVRDDGMIKGLFEGNGPGRCDLSGRFTVEVR